MQMMRACTVRVALFYANRAHAQIAAFDANHAVASIDRSGVITDIPKDVAVFSPPL